MTSGNPHRKEVTGQREPFRTQPGFTLREVRINPPSLYDGTTTGDPSTDREKQSGYLLDADGFLLPKKHPAPESNRALPNGRRKREDVSKVVVGTSWECSAGTRLTRHATHRHLVAFPCLVCLTNLLVCISA